MFVSGEKIKIKSFVGYWNEWNFSYTLRQLYILLLYLGSRSLLYCWVMKYISLITRHCSPIDVAMRWKSPFENDILSSNVTTSVYSLILFGLGRERTEIGKIIQVGTGIKINLNITGNSKGMECELGQSKWSGNDLLTTTHYYSPQQARLVKLTPST